MPNSPTPNMGGVNYASPTGAESPILPPVRDSLLQRDVEPLTRGMRQASGWLFLILVSTFTFLAYWNYSTEYHLHPEMYEKFANGQGSAPAQYRIALIFAAKQLHRFAHLGYRHSFSLFDFIFGLAAVFLIRGLLAGTKSFRAATFTSRWMRLAILIGLLSFYLNWSLWYQRPETMASAFFVAASLYLLTVVRSQSLLVSGLLVLAVWQGFVRADVAILFHFGLFLYILLRGSKDFPAARPVLLLTSLVGALLPTAILWVLMHKIFPYATYGDTKVFQLLYNILPTSLPAFILFIAPVFFTYKRAIARFSSLEVAQATLLLIGVIYFVSWALVGRVGEVRIFVPFALSMMPLSANLAADGIEAASLG